MSEKAVVELKSFSKKFGIILTPLVSAVTLLNDVLLPLAPFGLYLSFILVVTAILSLLSYPLFEKIALSANVQWSNEARLDLKKNTRQVGVVLLLLGLLSSASYIYGSSFTNNEGKPVGALSAKVPGVQGLQQNLGLIEEELRVISETLTSVDQGVQSIQTDTTALRDDSSVMRRQTATNIGMVYMAMTSGDLPALREAAQQGFNFANIHNPMAAGTSITYFTSALGSNHATIDDVLEFLYQNKALDPKASYIMQGNFPPATSTQVQNYMSAAIRNPVQNDSGTDGLIADLNEQKDKLSERRDQARACEMQARTELSELTSRLLDENRAEVDEHNKQVEQANSSEQLAEFNRRKRAEFEATQVKEWEAAAQQSLQQAKAELEKAQNLEGRPSERMNAVQEANLNLALLRNSINFGTANDDFDLPAKPTYSNAFRLPEGEGPQRRQYMLYTEANELAKAQLAQKSGCESQQQLKAQINEIDQEIQSLRREQRSQPTSRPAMPQVVRTESTLMMEAAFSGNSRAVEWFKGKGVQPKAASIRFSDGHVLKIDPQHYL